MPVHRNQRQVDLDLEDDEEIGLENEETDENESDDDEETQEEGDEESEGTPKKKSGQDRNTQILVSLLQDPQIGEAVKARLQGKNVKFTISDAQESSEEGSEEEEVDLEDDAQPPKKKGQFDIKSIVSAVKKELEPTTKKVETLMALAGQLQDDRAKNQIKELGEQYPDFKTVRKTMSKILRENPNLQLSEAYALAKVRKGQLKIESPSTHSERPGPSLRTRTSEKKKDERNQERSRHGRKAWNEILAGALDHLDDKE